MPVVARDLGGLRLYGWVFSAFMLGSIVGIVAAGREADRRGPAFPFAAGLVVFGAGLAVAGLAPSMPVLVAGRALQGVGAGAVPAVAYVSIGRSLAGPLRARMMAVLSTAWVAPGLAGPALSAEVAHVFGWRWVFLGLLPVVGITGSIALPALVRLGPPASRQAGEHRLTDGVRAAVGTALLLAGLTLAAGSAAAVAGYRAVAAGCGLIAAGAAIGLPATRRLVPPGTATARRGLPATILSRGLLTFAFFGADAYVTLTITVLRHRSTVLAGAAVTGSTLTWTVGAWAQARLATSWAGRRLVRTGLVIILAGICGMVLVLQPGVPVAVGVAAWTVAGLGMGLGYAPISLMMLREAPPGREGWASASLNLADVLGTATGIGLGGAAVAASTGRNLHWGVAVAFAVSGLAAVAALAVSGRLPAGLTGSAPPTGPAGASQPSGLTGSSVPSGLTGSSVPSGLTSSSVPAAPEPGRRRAGWLRRRVPWPLRPGPGPSAPRAWPRGTAWPAARPAPRDHRPPPPGRVR
jgi:MFS family permease